MILELNNVTYEYRTKLQTVRAVNGVSFGFEEGKFYAIIGKSGSGKTTLLSLMAGLDLPTSGEILYSGKPMKAIDTDEYRREHASVVYQSYNLFLKMTVLENAMVPLLLKKVEKGEARSRAAACLRDVDLAEDKFLRYPNMLSGGEQQRVAIARSLAGGQRIMLADEPTGNLDSENGKNVIEILKRLAHEKNMLVIVVTHDAEVSSQADIALRMSDGKLSVHGSEKV
ncbi:MAG: ABC transporter ATP-binding protein [Clostridia bacterium]|nr:ABC transporter ATP-binding protein [Clostridia bacterium]